MEKKKPEGQQDKPLKGQDLLRSIEAEYEKADTPEFNVGDTLEVGVKIREGDKTRVQLFSGICIARRGSGVRQTFTVRRIVQSEGVERVFPLHAPSIAHIKVQRRGKVRRAKLTYLRKRSDRGARLKERLEGKGQEGKAQQ
jgi:large subunit ribosomal protein L19